jgi:hypothetical protein
MSFVLTDYNPEIGKCATFDTKINTKMYLQL